MKVKSEEGSKAGCDGFTPPHNLMSREEMEAILSVAMNDFWTGRHRADSPAGDVIREAEMGSKALSTFSREELERMLNVIVGDLWLPRDV